MTWNYSGDPSLSDKDHVRFLIGDTDESDKLVQDEEIDFALSQHSTVSIAAALCLRALASKYVRWSSMSAGGVSASLSGVADGFSRRADQLDPSGVTKGSGLVIPKFGGLSIAEKEAFDSDTDAVQPLFKKGLDDIPGGPDLGKYNSPYDEDY